MDTHELFLAVVSKDSSFMHALALLAFNSICSTLGGCLQQVTMDLACLRKRGLRLMMEGAISFVCRVGEGKPLFGLVAYVSWVL